MMKDEWVTEALVDDMVVVELLCRLKQSSPEPPPVLPPLGWGNRQPRSKLVTMRKESSTTFSPTTPLSWSDGVGGSATPSDGESSRPSDLSSGARSKGPFTSEINSMCTTTNASRRKKTFIELKEEANVLLKERRHLKRELASMQVTLKEQRDTRENLKRIKVHFLVSPARFCMIVRELRWMMTKSSDHFSMQPCVWTMDCGSPLKG
ncbi:unnamed protein product [Ilex paraguariensis]|uniref:Uncharacterized protein n=1 Tax=Ilex paraguariensis TaxID=185542 RepID=A0ABC8SLS4_9AQUA